MAIIFHFLLGISKKKLLVVLKTRQLLKVKKKTKSDIFMSQVFTPSKTSCARNCLHKHFPPKSFFYEPQRKYVFFPGSMLYNISRYLVQSQTLDRQTLDTTTNPKHDKHYKITNLRYNKHQLCLMLCYIISYVYHVQSL